MITIKGRFATYGEIWFDEEPPPAPDVDVLTFRGRPEPLEGEGWLPFLTLVHDLSDDPERLMATFDPTVRNEIRRADAKDALGAELITAPRRELDAFCAFYDEFARQKSLAPAYRRGLESMCDAGRLMLSRARCNGRTLVWHAYVVSGGTAALLHSASHFRNMSNAARARVARANRWLHWRDMLAFKEMGLATYDWGGLFEDEAAPAHASVNSFKRRFGGRPHRAYTCVTLLTMKGRAYRAGCRLVEDVMQRSAGVTRLFKLLFNSTVSSPGSRRAHAQPPRV